MNKNHAYIILIAVVCLIAYSNIFYNEFVWDDHSYILDNSDIRSFNLRLFFSEDVDGIYRPVRSMHYSLIYSIAGKNEFFYHLNSIFLHILISIFVFLVIFEIMGKRNIALISALIFSLHPIHTSRVTNITAGFDLGGILLMLISFYYYIKYSKFGGFRYYLSGVFTYIIAIFSSEEAIVLPFIILLYEYIFKKNNFDKKTRKNVFFRKILPYFFVALFYLFIRFFVVGIKGRVSEYLAGSFFLTMLTMLKVYVQYIYLLFFPLNLTLFREITAVTMVFDIKMLFSGLIISIIILFAFISKNNILKFSIFWFFISLIPFSNILPLQVFIAERYLYVPSIAFSLLIAYFFVRLFNHFKDKKIKFFVLILLIFLLIFYTFSTINRNSEWRDNLTLWSRTIEVNPYSNRAYDNLGFTFERMGEDKKALEAFEKAVSLKPDDHKSLANLGVVLAKLGRYNESIKVLEKSISIRKETKTYDKLGLVYVEVDMISKAIESFEKAIEISPRYAKAHNDLGTVLGRIGEFDLALSEFNKAIKIDRDYADAHFNLGVMYEFLGEDESAKKEFELSFNLEPENELYRKKIGK